MQKVIIIGATSGIGEALARQLVQKGYFVGGCGRNAEKLEILENELGDRFIGHQLDIRETGTIDSGLSKLCDKLGGMDICIVSSGISNKNELLNLESIDCPRFSQLESHK